MIAKALLNADAAGLAGEPFRPRVLLVEDEVLLAQTTSRMLRRRGYDVEVCRDVAAACVSLNVALFEILLVDLALANVAAFGLLERASELPERPLTILIADPCHKALAVEGLRRGAADFITKPFAFGDLEIRLEKLLQTATMRRRFDAMETRVCTSGPIVVSARMKQAFDLADRVATTPASSAMILGESGAGKEVVAARIHQQSARCDAPFVRVNLAAIAESMVEAELFGSVRGAFTDSTRDRPGLFATADQGTILLDELCEFRIDLQSKLLRVIEERRFFPVGSDRERRVDVRVLAATNRDPQEAIARGHLREDLFFRLGTVCIEVPPLRERRDDILPLMRHFVRYFASEFGRNAPSVGPDVTALLLDHSWPGNVRELRNAVERALIMEDGSVLSSRAFHLSGSGGSRDADTSPIVEAGLMEELPLRLEDATRDAIAHIERAHIERVLRLASGSRTCAAEMLDVSRTTLWQKMKRYGLL